jgi:hypothetical protein
MWFALTASATLAVAVKESCEATGDCPQEKDGDAFSKLTQEIREVKRVQWDTEDENFVETIAARREPTVLVGGPPSRWEVVDRWSKCESLSAQVRALVWFRNKTTVLWQALVVW